MDAAEAAVQSEFPAGSKACLIVELEGTPEQVAAERPELQRILDASGAIQIRVARDAVDRMRIWKGRKSAFSAVGRLSPDFIVQDGVVPRRNLGEALRRIGEASKRYGLRVANVFHAGDGNLHPLILYDGRIAGELEKAEELSGEILVMCVEMGGSITGEHGIGLEKRAFLPHMFSADDIEMMQRVRRQFDPNEIANRGKMFPGGDAPALVMRGLHPLEAAGVISRE
jgi:glycolate oxidase